MSAPEVSLRRATMRDVEPMMDLINGLAAEGLMLPRSPASIVELSLIHISEPTRPY